jgi:hypothetical protein
MFGQKRKDRGLGKDDEALGGNRGQHGRFFLEAKERARAGAYGRHHHFQSAVGGLGKVSLTRKHGTQFGQDLGGEQRRPACKKRVGQFFERRELQSTLA